VEQELAKENAEVLETQEVPELVRENAEVVILGITVKTL
jgi:hypothetical protein